MVRETRRCASNSLLQSHGSALGFSPNALLPNALVSSRLDLPSSVVIFCTFASGVCSGCLEHACLSGDLGVYSPSWHI